MGGGVWKVFVGGWRCLEDVLRWVEVFGRCLEVGGGWVEVFVGGWRCLEGVYRWVEVGGGCL